MYICWCVKVHLAAVGRHLYKFLCMYVHVTYALWYKYVVRERDLSSDF